MEVFTVAFFGHRQINNIMKIEDILYEHIRTLVSEKYFVDFLVGRNGDFDICVSSVINRVKRDLDNFRCSHSLVLPYVTAELVNNEDSFEEYYDSISIYDSFSTVHPKAAISLRNIEMVDRADLILCYINKNEGGAYKAVKYAEKQGKDIINIHNEL